MSVPVSPATGRKYSYRYWDTKKVHQLYQFTHTQMTVGQLPPEVSQLQWMPPVYDQGNEGCCTAFGAKEVREWLSARYPGKLVPLSAQFQYYCELLLNGSLPNDEGSTVATAMMSMRMFGICPDADEPFTTPFAQKPSKRSFADAARYKIGNIYSINTLTDMKSALAAGFVFELGFLVYESFESDSVASTGIMTMPVAGEQLLGGHATCAWGYNDDFEFPGLPNGALCLRNSWGAWGNNGNFFMPYGYISGVDPSGNGPYVSDCHMCHLGPVWS
jgi:C1A family cysteine protease